MRGIPPPFIKIYERGRDTPHPSLLPLMLMRKDFLDGVLVNYGKRLSQVITSAANSIRRSDQTWSVATCVLVVWWPPLLRIDDERI